MKYHIKTLCAVCLLYSCSGNDTAKVSQETKNESRSEQAEAAAFNVLYTAFDADNKNYKIIFSDAEGNTYFNSYYEGEEKMNKNIRLQLERKNEYEVRQYRIISGADSGKFIVVNELNLKIEGIDEAGKRFFSLKLMNN